MAIAYKKTTFDTEKHFLAIPDHYVNTAYMIPKDSPLAVTHGNRKIVKAGTIYPANDATAIGLVFSDVDVTDGDQNVAVCIHGFIATKRLATAPTTEAKVAMRLLSFLPLYTPPEYTPPSA